MKKLIIIASVLSIVLFSCISSNTEVNKPEEYIAQGKKVEGDLFFNFIRFGSLYKKDISSPEDVSQQLDTMQTTNRGEDSIFIILYKKLNENELLYSPFIEVVMENDTHTTWYLNEEDYESIKQFKIKDLKANKKKVHITADIEKIYQNAYKCSKILKIELVDQEDFSISDKWSGGDYK